MTTEEAGYKRNTVQSCDNCANKGYYHTQGWSTCNVIDGDFLVYWSTMSKCVCAYWSPEHVPTEREIALSKISYKDKKILGLV